MIGDNIEIKIVGVDGDLVRIGIEAPREVEVYRKEIYMAIKEENQMAVKNSADMALIKQLLLAEKSDET